MKRKILFTGSDGMVGSYIDSVNWHDRQVIKTTRRDFDVRDWVEVSKYFKRLNEDLFAIIHMAAETDVDLCERNQIYAWGNNSTGTLNMSTIAAGLDIPIVYISTIGVFGGDSEMGPFNEESLTCPANYYGQTKLRGEEYIRPNEKHFIVRAGWMMGGGLKKDKKFVVKIVKQLIGGKKKIYAIPDIIGSPTYGKDLLRQISALLLTEEYGTYHCTNEGALSRYDVAKIICEELAPDVEVVPVDSNYFNLPAQRAMSEAYVNKKLIEKGINVMTSLEVSLKRYIRNEIKEDYETNSITDNL